MTDVKWYGPQVMAAIKAEFARRIARCCILLVNHAKLLLSVEGTAKRTDAQAAASSKRAKTFNAKYKAGIQVGAIKRKRGKKAGSLVYDHTPAAAGDPPHIQRGRLRGSVAWQVLGLVGRVGTNYLVGRWQELGTRNMPAHPWLRPAAQEKQAEITQILSAPMKGP